MPIEGGVLDLDELSRACAVLEPLPVSVTRLAVLVADEAPDVAGIVDIVRYDLALTAVLLRRANSSWSASRTEITTLPEAVVRLGAGPVLALALGVNVRARFAPAIPEYGLPEDELWNHSVAAMLAAEGVMAAAPTALPAETPTAALLHDVGKLVMARFVAPEALHEIGVSMASGATRAQAEVEVLGVDHAELGGAVAHAWELPGSLVAAIVGHHAPGTAPGGAAGPALVAHGVLLADAVARAVRSEDPGRAGPEPHTAADPLGAVDSGAVDSSLAALGLPEGALAAVSRAVAARFAEVVTRFG